MNAPVHRTIGALLSESAARYPNHAAIEYDGAVTTYAALLARAKAIAKGLLAIGMHKGSHIAIWSADRPNTLACFYAATLIGAVAVLPNTSLRQNEMCKLLLDSDADLLLYGDGYKDVRFPDVVRALPPLPRIENHIYIGEAGLPQTDDLDALILRGQYTSNNALSLAMACVTPSDSAAMLFTSGTVGASKGVLTSHFSRVNSAVLQARDIAATCADRFLAAIPMFHCFSLSVNILGAMSVGGCVFFPENRRTKSVLSAIRDGRCTVFCAVPTLLSALLARPDLAEYDLSSLRVGLVGGAAPSPEQMLDFRERLGYELLPSLGLTEATAGITVASPSDPLAVKLETVGHFMDFIEGRILDPATGAECPVGTVEEICVRGYCVMQGYYNLPRETREAIDEAGFLHTGDMGFLDASDNVHFVGRRKEIIVRGGENIFPGEIEDCIKADCRVRDVRVIGVPDAHYGEVVCACVVPASGATLPPDDVRSLVKEALAYYKAPRYVLTFDELPRGDSGKVQMQALRVLAQEKLREGNPS